MSLSATASLSPLSVPLILKAPPVAAARGLTPPRVARAGQSQCPGVSVGTSGPEDWGFGNFNGGVYAGGGQTLSEVIGEYTYNLVIDGSSVSVQQVASNNDVYNLGSHTGVVSQEGSDVFVEAGWQGDSCGEAGNRASHISLKLPTQAYPHGRFHVTEIRTCYYQIELFLDACYLCAPGTDRNWYQPRCESCPAGRFKESTGRVATFHNQELCTACAPGTDTNGLEGYDSACVSCPANKYSDTAGGSCTYCPAGSDTRGNLGSTSCTTCAAGTYNPGGSQDGCQACPAGSETRLSNVFHSGDGATDCQLCPQGQHSPVSTTQCSACGENELTGDSAGAVVTGTGATTCLAKATCGDADGEGLGTAPVSSTDCGSGLVYDTSASAEFCASVVCDVAGTPGDTATCCGAPATCGDLDGAGAGSTGVSDADCGVGFVVRPASEATPCESTTCDIAGAHDKDACCIAVVEPAPSPPLAPSPTPVTEPTSTPSPAPVTEPTSTPSPPPVHSQGTEMYKIGGGIAYNKAFSFTDSPTVSVGSGMICRKQPAGSNIRYLCK